MCWLQHATQRAAMRMEVLVGCNWNVVDTLKDDYITNYYYFIISIKFSFK